MNIFKLLTTSLSKLLGEFLDPLSLVRLDSACTSESERQIYLNIISNTDFTYCGASYIISPFTRGHVMYDKWLMLRKIKPRAFQLHNTQDLTELRTLLDKVTSLYIQGTDTIKLVSRFPFPANILHVVCTTSYPIPPPLDIKLYLQWCLEHEHVETFTLKCLFLDTWIVRLNKKRYKANIWLTTLNYRCISIITKCISQFNIRLCDIQYRIEKPDCDLLEFKRYVYKIISYHTNVEILHYGMNKNKTDYCILFRVGQKCECNKVKCRCSTDDSTRFFSLL